MPEANFGFRRMDIDIHFLAIAIDKQQREGITRGRHQVVIGGRERVQQQTVANQAAIHKQIDRVPIGLLHLRPGDETSECEDARGTVVSLHHFEVTFHIVQVDQVFERLISEYLIDALLERLYRRYVQQLR